MKLNFQFFKNLTIGLLTDVAVLIFILFISSCTHKKTEEKYVINIDMKVSAINYDCSLTNDKFHTPQLCNTILFETLTEPKLYREFNTCKLPNSVNSSGSGSDIHINNVWIYNHRVGDIVHFDYLLKSEFFEIKPRK